MRKLTLLAFVLALLCPSSFSQTVVVQPAPQPNVVVMPASKTKADYLADFAKYMNETAERDKEREHELQMQREWIEAQKAPNLQAPQPSISTATSVAAVPQPDICKTSVPALSDASITLGYFNGRLWAEMTFPQRLFYIEGLSDMLTTTRPPSFEGYNCSCTIGEFLNGVTEFYNSDQTFRTLPITFAMLMYAQRAKGEAPELIAARARGYLKYLV